MKTSELTYSELADYLRIEPDDLTAMERNVLDAFLEAARTYAANYTGRTAQELDGYPDIAIAVLCVAGDMYTNRDRISTVKGSANQTVDSILSMYRVNLLPTPETEEEE